VFGDDLIFSRCNTSKQGLNLLYQNRDQNLAFRISSLCFLTLPTAVDARERHATGNIDCSDVIAYGTASRADLGEKISQSMRHRDASLITLSVRPKREDCCRGRCSGWLILHLSWRRMGTNGEIRRIFFPTSEPFSASPGGLVGYSATVTSWHRCRLTVPIIFSRSTDLTPYCEFYRCKPAGFLSHLIYLQRGD
jgi:hypothetical protein